MFELGLVVAFTVGFLLCWRPSRIAIGSLLVLGFILSDPLRPAALLLIAVFLFGLVREWRRGAAAGLAEEPAAEG